MRIQPPPIGRLETRVWERVPEQRVRAQVQKQRVLPVQELALKLAREPELKQELERKPEQAQQRARKPWRSRKPAFEPAF